MVLSLEHDSSMDGTECEKHSPVMGPSWPIKHNSIAGAIVNVIILIGECITDVMYYFIIIINKQS